MKTALNIEINGNLVPTIQYPKILGITFDPLLTCSKQATIVNANPIVGCNWGKEKETLLTTYKAIGRYFANYDAPL